MSMLPQTRTYIHNNMQPEVHTNANNNHLIIYKMYFTKQGKFMTVSKSKLHAFEKVFVDSIHFESDNYIQAIQLLSSYLATQLATSQLDNRWPLYVSTYTVCDCLSKNQPTLHLRFYQVKGLLKLLIFSAVINLK